MTCRARRITLPVSWRRCWLSGAIWKDGVRLAGVPQGHSADIVLTSKGVRLGVGDEAVTLSWNTYRSKVSSASDLVEVGVAVPDAWTFAYWSSESIRKPGAVIMATGAIAASCGGLVQSLRTWRNRLANVLYWNGENGLEEMVPLATAGPSMDAVPSVRSLAMLLSRHEGLRAALDVGSSGRAIASELAVGGFVPGPMPASSALRRVPFEIDTAMERAGVVHPLGGRPLPTDEILSEDEAVELVLHDLNANPYSASLVIDEGTVRQRVVARYLTPEPWPVNVIRSETGSS